MKRLTVVLVLILMGLLGSLGYFGLRYMNSWESGSNATDQVSIGLPERAEQAKMFALQNGLSLEHCLLVDYSIPSGTPRLFVWSFTEGRVVAKFHVMHGPGGGSTDQKPVFSNTPGSNCSALGHFMVTNQHGVINRDGLRLSGLDEENRTAFNRGLMIHKSVWVDMYCNHTYIPLNSYACLGCVTITTRGMEYIGNLARNDPKRMLLWSYCS